MVPQFYPKMEVIVKSYTVNDLMVPLSEYATVSEDATLYEAVLSLEEAQEKFEDKHTRYRHRGILILDKDGNVAGKLSQLDVLRALEPKYQKMIQGEGLHRFGFTKQFMKSMLEDYHLFTNPLDDICRKAESRTSNNLWAHPPRANRSPKTHPWMSLFISLSWDTTNLYW